MDGYVHPDFAPVATKLGTLLGKRKAHGGAAVAIYHHGEMVADLWGGVRDQHGNPWERDTAAMSFSTTKGVVATVLHRLADRGEVSYGAPVATYWPEFAAGGKEQVTIRDLLTHRAALHNVRALIDEPEELFDWDHMTAKLAAASPAWEPGIQPGYHAMTFGWLVGEVIRRVTGLTVDEAVQREIAEPLGLEGLHVGAPEEIRPQVAELLIGEKARARLDRMVERMQRYERFQPFLDALMVDGFMDYVNTDQLYDAEIPAANGVFTARGLAGMYAALVTPETSPGGRLVSDDTLDRATVIQTTRRDVVVGFRMRWRLGYHLAGTSAGVPASGFGHFGFGGSGAWGDPERGLAVAMVLNDVAGTPFGDMRFVRIGGAALRAARRRDGVDS